MYEANLQLWKDHRKLAQYILKHTVLWILGLRLHPLLSFSYPLKSPQILVRQNMSRNQAYSQGLQVNDAWYPLLVKEWKRFPKLCALSSVFKTHIWSSSLLYWPLDVFVLSHNPFWIITSQALIAHVNISWIVFSQMVCCLTNKCITQM